MAEERFRTEPLDSHHVRATFSCGVAALDRYFQHQAGQDLRRRLAAIFVLHDRETSLVAGYYTLSTAIIRPESLPPELVRKLPRYAEFPAVLIGRLAVDLRYRGQGLGSLMLFDAFRRALAQTAQIAAMAVIVDAKDDRARLFYERYGFRRFADDEFRLFFLMADVAKVV